jgi:thioredoxin-related protein
MDFWFADCAPCHQLFKQLKKVKEYFKTDSNVVFLNISIDNKEVWQKSLSKFKIEGYHVFTEGKEATHQVISDYQVYGYPTNRLIDKKGTFFIVAPSDNPEELIKQINEALKK